MAILVRTPTVSPAANTKRAWRARPHNALYGAVRGARRRRCPTEASQRPHTPRRRNARRSPPSPPPHHHPTAHDHHRLATTTTPTHTHAHTHPTHIHPPTHTRDNARRPPYNPPQPQSPRNVHRPKPSQRPRARRHHTRTPQRAIPIARNAEPTATATPTTWTPPHPTTD